MASWREWYPPTQPIAVKNGIKARSKRGNIGETWWSQRFIAALEKIGIGSRLERGRKYARRGQVIDIGIRDAAVHAQVQGSISRPYNITISFTRFSDKQWEQVFDVLSSQALFTAMLLSGEFPQEIETIFTGVKLSLFPASAKDIRASCDCPDYANPCKHIAAVYYILAEQFDRDPFLIFTLRGREREVVLENLRKRRSTNTPACDVAGDTGQYNTKEQASYATGQQDLDRYAVLPLSDCITSFWEGGEGLDTFPVHLYQKPLVEALALKRLGPSPFKIQNRDLSTLLIPVYPRARECVWGELRRLEQKHGRRGKRAEEK